MASFYCILNNIIALQAITAQSGASRNVHCLVMEQYLA